MTKKLLLLNLIMCLAFAGCNKNDIQIEHEQILVPVTVYLSGFEISQEEFQSTRSTTVNNYNDIKFITLAFYKSDNTEVYKHTQVRGDATTYTTFGVFSTLLPKGSYTMVALANAGNNEITLTSPTAATYGTNNVKDTFAATQAVTVTNTSSLTLNTTMNRIVTALAVQSTDNRPTEVSKVRFTYSGGGKSFNPTTGLATSNASFSTSFTLSNDVGTTCFIGGYLFLASDEQNINVTIETLDADDQVVMTKAISNVPFKRNRQTTLTGRLFSAEAGCSFSVNELWIDAHEMTF